MNSLDLESRPGWGCFRRRDDGWRRPLASLWIIIVTVTFLWASALSAAEKKSVLVLTQGNGRQPSLVEFMSGFQQNLATNLNGPLTVYIENLDLQHFDRPDYRREIIEWLRVKYRGCKLDVIVANNEPTADITFKLRSELWPQTPVVLVDAGRMEVADIATETNVTVISAHTDVQGTLAAAWRLCPDTRRVAFVSSGKNGFAELYERDLNQLEELATNRFEIIPLIGLTMAETKKRLAALPAQTIVFYNGIWIDAAGQFYTTREALRELSPFSRAPIFSYSETFIGCGMVGGSCHDYFGLGVEAAGQVAAVIRAGTANSVPGLRSTSDRLIFDWQQLHRFGLDTIPLPPGSDVQFQPPSLWKTYHLIMVIVAAALAMQTALIMLLLIQRRRMRQAEEELFESRQMLRTVLDTIPQRVFWKDRNSVFLGCNKPLAKDCGYPDVSMLIGKTDHETVAAPLAERYRANDREVMETNQPRLNYEEPQNREDGSIRWLRTNKVPLHDKDGRVIGVLGTYEDITELKHAEKVMREGEQWFRSLMDNAPDAIFLQTKGSIVYANLAALRLIRAERPDQLLGRSMLDLVAPEWHKVVTERMQRSNLTDDPLPPLDEEYVRLDQSRVAVEVTAVPTVFQSERSALVFVRDITERKRVAETIIYERQLLRTLLDLLPDSVYIKDLDGRFLMANKSLAKRFGKDDPAQLLGLSDKEFFPVELAADLHVEEAKVFAGETISEKEVTFVLPDGQKRTLLVTKAPFRNSQGQICGLVGTGRDITERKQLEEQLRQSQKMEAFGQLAGGIAHDFNNLLTIILGNVSFLQLGESLPPDHAAGLGEISQAAERAANLTRQLLTFSRRQIFQPKPIDLNDAVTTTTKMLQRLIGEHIALETHFAPGGAPALADITMMEQLLINLAVNSRDAMPKGGRLIIQTAAISISQTAARANAKVRAGSFIRLSITDTGCGIAPDQTDRIFEPFFTTKDIGKGTGLGLATVFGIVAQHHGWIEVESKINVGTTFHIYLPRLADNTRALIELPGTVDVRGGNETILLVEDEASVRLLTRKLLERKGYRIIEADSGPGALKLWGLNRDTIDLLLTDMVMPGGISGRELAEQLQSEKPRLKVIYFSGYTDDMLGKDSPLRNNKYFMEKPFDPVKFLQTVRDCADERTAK